MSYEHARTRVVKVNGKPVRVVIEEPAYASSYDEAPLGLGLSWSDFNPLTLAQKIQAGADKIESNIAVGVNKLQSGVQRIDTTAASVANIANRVGAGVQGAARGGIASAGTGDATSGLALAGLATKPALVLGGIIAAMWLFAKHPGHRRW
jgi:hypothetical protein